MGQRGIILALLAATGCGPHLHPAVVRGHPSLSPAQPRAVLIAQSAEGRPSWLNEGSATATAGWQVIGQGRGPDLAEAEAKARANLLQAIGELVAVEVEYEHQSIQEHRRTQDHQEERSVAHEEARARSQVGQVLKDAAVAEARYWEQVSVAGRPPYFRAFVLARIDRRLLEAARLEAQLDAARGRGHKITVLCPASEAVGPATSALITALQGRLLAAPNLAIVGPLPPPLVADLEIVVAVRSAEGGHQAQLRVIDRAQARGWSRSVHGPTPFALEDRVAAILLEALGGER